MSRSYKPRKVYPGDSQFDSGETLSEALDDKDTPDVPTLEDVFGITPAPGEILHDAAERVLNSTKEKQ